MLTTKNTPQPHAIENKQDDPYGVWNGKHFELTLRKVCMICYGSDDMIPAEIEPMADDILSQINMEYIIGPNGIKLLFDGRHDVQEHVDYMKRQLKWHVIIITPRVLKDEEGHVYPTIYDENPQESFIMLIRYLKSIFPMPTAGITASAGKTTTTMLAHWAISEKYNVYNSVADGANMNDVKAIGRRWFLFGGNQFNFYLQEAALGKSKVRDIIKMIDPDVFAVNNIDKRQHLDDNESEESIIADKLSFDEIGKKDGVMVVNIDDPIIAAHKFKHKTVTFALNNKSADCVGKNIVTGNMSIEMDVDYEGHTTHLKAHLPGKVNAYNLMSAYLVAKQFGVTDAQIQRGFLKYRSRGIRQKVERIGGRVLYVDTFNYPKEGIMTSLDTLSKMKLGKNGRKFAVLTEKDSFDEESYRNFYEYGVEMGQFKNIDQFVMLGEPAEGGGFKDDAIYKGLLSVFSEEKVKRLPTPEAIAEYLQNETKIGDAILIKGRGNKHMYRVFDMAFGTSYAYIAHLYPPAAYLEPTDKINGKYTEMIGGVSIIGKKIWNENNLFIPDEINEHKVVRIAEDAFVGDKAIRTVSFGKYLRSTGERSFKGCVGIERINLPPSLMLVDKNAFEGCTNLVSANMIYVQHVDKEAFKGCKNLRRVVLGSRCGFISTTAFADCPDVTIFAPRGSYASRYAIKHGIRRVWIDEEKEKSRLTEWGSPKKALYGLSYNIPEKEDNKLTVLACGSVLRDAYKLPPEYNAKDEKYFYDLSYKHTFGAIRSSDICICNVESTLGSKAFEPDMKEELANRFGGKKTKEFKAFKEFNGADALAAILKRDGFDVAVCANNHANDCGYNGIIETKQVLEKNGLAVSGIKSNPEEKGYCIVEKKGIKVAVVNYAYVWYDQDNNPSMDGEALSEETQGVLNTFSVRTLEDDLKNIKKSVDSAKEEADIIIAYYHWGTKNKRHANMLQRYIAYKTAEMGVDAIIGTHPNVLEEKEIINVNRKEVPVYYSIGDVLNGKYDNTIKELGANGCMAKLEFDIDPETKKIKGMNAGYVPTRTLQEQIGERWEYTTVDLEHMKEKAIHNFAYACPLTPEEITGQIEESLNYVNDTIMCVDEMIDISTEERNDLKDNEIISKAVGDSKVIRYLAENNGSSSIKGVKGDSIVFANNPGITGVTAYTDDGKKYQFMLRATGRLHRQTFALPDLKTVRPPIRER